MEIKSKEILITQRESKMNNAKVYKDKTYRLIEVGGKTYSGKDSYKKRTSDYILGMFESEYFKGKRVLDLACASGAILFAIHEQVKKAVGVEVDSKKLNIGKDIAKENNISNINLIENKLEPYLKSAEEDFDCIFLLNILHHLQEPYLVLDLVCELSKDKICLELPIEGFYDAYKRDEALPPPEENPSAKNIIEYLEDRNYTLLYAKKSENQENFIGPERWVYLLQKKKINFIESKKSIESGIIIGPGASGKTRLINEIYGKNIEITNGIVKNNIYNDEGKSLKYGKNTEGINREKYPVLYMAPNHGVNKGYVPNVDLWIEELKKSKEKAIVCYTSQSSLLERLENRLVYHRLRNNKNQIMDNYPFCYQRLFNKLDSENIDYVVVDCRDKD